MHKARRILHNIVQLTTQSLCSQFTTDWHTLYNLTAELFFYRMCHVKKLSDHPLRLCTLTSLNKAYNIRAVSSILYYVVITDIRHIPNVYMFRIEMPHLRQLT